MGLADFFNFFTAIVLAAIAVLFLLVMLRFILAPALPLLRSGRGPWRVRRAVRRLDNVDKLIAENRSKEALAELRRSLILDIGANDSFIAAVRDHHQNILSRCLVIAEQLGTRAENIALVERLMFDRAELQLNMLRAAQSYSNLHQRRSQAGKSTPAWGKAEHHRKVSDIKARLRENKRELEKELAALFRSISAPAEERIVYH